MHGSLVVKNKPLGHYVLSVFSMIFRGEEHDDKGNIYLHSPSSAISRTVDLSNLLTDAFAGHLLSIDSSYVDRMDAEGSFYSPDSSADNEGKVSSIELALSRKSYPTGSTDEPQFQGFIDKFEDSLENSRIYNVCELEFILSSLVKKGYTLHLNCIGDKEIDLGSKEKTAKGRKVSLGAIYQDEDRTIKYDPSACGSSPINFEESNEVNSSIEAALMRMGLVRSRQYQPLVSEMTQHDDVIVAIDTNMFYHAQVTSALLDSFVGYVRSNYLDTPNWVTVVASSVSVGELEHNANRPPSKVKDTQNYRSRRRACRGLQEFMEIGSCVDLEGVSIFLTGEIPPQFDFSQQKGNIMRDEKIRYQVKTFLKDLDFQKGTYFLTEDKICEMFAEAEGLNSFYLPRRGLEKEETPYTLCSLSGSRDIYNISELVYELAVEFPVEINATGGPLGDLKLQIESDWAEKSLEDWANRKIQMTTSGIKSKMDKIDNTKDELEKFNQKKKELAGNVEATEELDQKISSLEKKLDRLRTESKEAKIEEEKLEGLVGLLEEEGLKIGIDELFSSWEAVNEKRHVF